MKDKALPVFERNNVKRERIERPSVNYIPPVDPNQDTVEKKWGELWSRPEGKAVHVIGLNEAGMIRVKGISFCKGIKGQGGR